MNQFEIMCWRAHLPVFETSTDAGKGMILFIIYIQYFMLFPDWFDNGHRTLTATVNNNNHEHVVCISTNAKKKQFQSRSQLILLNP